jgi:hypothetical protein
MLLELSDLAASEELELVSLPVASLELDPSSLASLLSGSP